MKKINDKIKIVENTNSEVKQVYKALDLVDKAVKQGWKIDIETKEPDNLTDTANNEVVSYIYAPERWNEDYIGFLHISRTSYHELLLSLKLRLEKVMNSYYCPYCSMLNGEGKVWGKPVINDCYPANDDKTGEVRLVKYEDQIRVTVDDIPLTNDDDKPIYIKNCPFCGRKL